MNPDKYGTNPPDILEETPVHLCKCCFSTAEYILHCKCDLFVLCQACLRCTMHCYCVQRNKRLGA
jgi:hypothetical protein